MSVFCVWHIAQTTPTNNSLLLTLLTWLKAQQECLYAQNYSLLTPEYKLALHKIFIELIKPYKDIVTEYYETRKSNAMSSTLDIEFDNRL